MQYAAVCQWPCCRQTAHAVVYPDSDVCVGSTSSPTQPSTTSACGNPTTTTSNLRLAGHCLTMARLAGHRLTMERAAAWLINQHAHAKPDSIRQHSATIRHQRAILHPYVSPYGPHMGLYGIHTLHYTASIRHPYGIHTVSIRHPYVRLYGIHTVSIRHAIRYPYGIHTASIRHPYGIHTASIRHAIRHPYGFYTLTVWMPYSPLVPYAAVWKGPQKFTDAGEPPQPQIGLELYI